MANRFRLIRFVLVGFFLAFFGLRAFCQSGTYISETRFNLNIKYSQGSAANSVSCFNSKYFLFYYDSIMEEDLAFKNLNLKKVYPNSSSAIDVQLVYPDSISLQSKSFGRINALFISRNSKYLIVSHFRVQVLFVSRNNKYIFKKVLSVGHYVESMEELNNSTAVLYTCYNYHPLDQMHTTSISTLDLRSGVITNTIHPKISGIEFSHLIHHWITITKNTIAFCDPLKFQVNFYNSKLSNFKSYNLEPPKWMNCNLDTLLSTFNILSAKSSISKILSKDDSICRIEKIYWLNQRKLLISYKLLGEKQTTRHLLIYDYNRNKVIKDSKIDIGDFFYMRDSLLNRQRPFPEITYSSSLYFKKNAVFMFSQYYLPVKLEYISGKPGMEARKKYLKTNGMQWTLIKLRLSFL